MGIDRTLLEFVDRWINRGGVEGEVEVGQGRNMYGSGKRWEGWQSRKVGCKLETANEDRNRRMQVVMG